jgi:transposase
MDNASVHCGDDTFDLLRIVLDQAGVKIIFLPKYSPEFNPCELVFAKIKHLLRWYRDPSLPLWEQLVWALANVTYEDVLHFYWKCTQQICFEN